MPLRVLLLTLSVATTALLGVACNFGKCQSPSDCPQGQGCGANGECTALTPAAVADAGHRDRRLPDLGIEDSAAEDAPPGSDIGTAGIDGGSIGVDGGSAQVSTLTVCQRPRAVALARDGVNLYVACQQGDAVKIYSATGGSELRTLSSLPSPCKPSSLHLREDFGQGGQLWLSCSDTSSLRVYNVDPQSGAARDNGFPFGSADSDGALVRFASGGARIAWVEAGRANYVIHSVNSGTDVSTPLATRADLSFGNGIGASSDGSHLYMTNSIADRVTQRGPNGELLQDLSPAIQQTKLAAVASSNGVIFIVNDVNYVRLEPSGNAANPLEQLQGVGAGRASAIAIAPNGSAAYIATYFSGTRASQILRLSTDPANHSPLLATVDVSSCHITDLAAANDGRVFAPCFDVADEVRVVTFP